MESSQQLNERYIILLILRIKKWSHINKIGTRKNFNSHRSIKEIDFIIKNLPTNKTQHSKLKVCTCQFKIQGRNENYTSPSSKESKKKQRPIKFMEPELP